MPLSDGRGFSSCLPGRHPGLLPCPQPAPTPGRRRRARPPERAVKAPAAAPGRGRPHDGRRGGRHRGSRRPSHRRRGHRPGPGPPRRRVRGESGRRDHVDRAHATTTPVEDDPTIITVTTTPGEDVAGPTFGTTTVPDLILEAPPAQGEALGRILIPAAGVDWVIVEGVIPRRSWPKGPATCPAPPCRASRGTPSSAGTAPPTAPPSTASISSAPATRSPSRP